MAAGIPHRLRRTRYNREMRFRTGLLVGLAVGYYYGAKAGRERAAEIDRWLDKLRTTTTYQDARTKLSDGLREGTLAARHLIDDAARAATSPTDDFRTTVADPTLN